MDDATVVKYSLFRTKLVICRKQDETSHNKYIIVIFSKYVNHDFITHRFTRVDL